MFTLKYNTSLQDLSRSSGKANSVVLMWPTNFHFLQSSSCSVSFLGLYPSFERISSCLFVLESTHRRRYVGPHDTRLMDSEGVLPGSSTQNSRSGYVGTVPSVPSTGKRSEYLYTLRVCHQSCTFRVLFISDLLIYLLRVSLLNRQVPVYRSFTTGVLTWVQKPVV